MSFPTFSEFFHALWDYDPFPWQTMLAEHTLSGEWPEAIDLPTASGKTACLDVAIYTLAAQAEMPIDKRMAPRRIWFVVDRRIVVDEAFSRAERIAKGLRDTSDGPLKEVATRLRLLSGLGESAPPLAVGRLRGGVIRDDHWARLPSQPAILTSTVDQVGSRLLFRGYGFRDSLAPIHAGLAANDSLIILDEAHCAKPFFQTLRAIRNFRGSKWAKEPIPLPFQFAAMSATLASDSEDHSKRFPQLHKRDAALNHPVLKMRGTAIKSAELALATTPAKPKKGQPHIGKAADSEPDPLVLAAAQRALEYVKTSGRKRVAVMVNRVATAQSIHRQLFQDLKEEAEIILLTGRMRPIERDWLVVKWEKYLRANNPDNPERPIILVTTQCLEVGADYSFDALITECASLDALRQRFGRLNRLGLPVESPALILICADDAKGKTEDPIYGFAMAKTWEWLQSLNGGGSVDFGIEAMNAQLPPQEAELRELYAESEEAPILLPAHLDALCQTSPHPEPEPDIDFFLHGKRRRSAEVQVIWRADLALSEEGNPNEVAWIEAVALVPPTSAETLTVPLHRLVSWLTASASDEDSDVEGGIIPTEREEPSGRVRTPFLLWRGQEASRVTYRWRDIRPGDRVVLPASSGMEGLGQVTSDSGLGQERLDLAERANRGVRPQLTFRFTPSTLAPWQKHPAIRKFFAWLDDMEDNWTRDEVFVELKECLEAIRFPAEPEPIDHQPNWPDWLLETLEELLADSKSFRVVSHPASGLLLSTALKKPPSQAEENPFGDADDTTSRTVAAPVSLAQHTRDILFVVERLASKCLPTELHATFQFSARTHDLGKLDPRFQILLHNGDEAAALSGVTEPLAKSSNLSQSPKQRGRLRRQSGLPVGFRHEALSWQMLKQIGTGPEIDRDLAAHLNISHHGYARPLQPVVNDDLPPAIDLNCIGIPLHISSNERSTWTPVHRLDSGVTETFWRLNRRFGWWGLAALESVFRLADWQASRHPCCASEGDSPFAGISPLEKAPAIVKAQPTDCILLTGLDAANPLGYLAALGVLRTLTHAFPEHGIHMHWVSAQGGWRPELECASPLQKEEVVETLLTQAVSLDAMFSPKLLSTAPEQGPKNKKAELSWTDKLMFPIEIFRAYLKDAVEQSSFADPLRAEWAASWAGETSPQESNKILVARRSRFDFTAGQQCFIGMLRELHKSVTAEDLIATLFGPWNYSTTATSLRWDPLDEKRQYALQAFDPTNSSANPSLSDLGANFLAVAGLACFPFMANRDASQPGFHGRGSNRRFQSYIWEFPLDYLSIQTLLSLSKHHSQYPMDQLGIAQQLESTIVQPSGRYRCFTPMRAV